MHNFTNQELKQIGKKYNMRYVIKDNMFKGSNVDLCLNKLQAYSYNWWCFLKKDDNSSFYIFNDYNYSTSTNRHQQKVRQLLEDLNLNIKTIRITMLESLHNNDWKNIYTRNQYLKAFLTLNDIHKPRTHKKTNERRRIYINHQKKDIDIMQNFGIIDIDLKRKAFKHALRKLIMYRKQERHDQLKLTKMYKLFNGGK